MCVTDLAFVTASDRKRAQTTNRKPNSKQTTNKTNENANRKQRKNLSDQKGVGEVAQERAHCPPRPPVRLTASLLCTAVHVHCLRAARYEYDVVRNGESRNDRGRVCGLPHTTSPEPNALHTALCRVHTPRRAPRPYGRGRARE